MSPPWSLSINRPPFAIPRAGTAPIAGGFQVIPASVGMGGSCGRFRNSRTPHGGNAHPSLR